MKYFVEVNCPPGHVNFVDQYLKSELEAGHKFTLITFDGFREKLSVDCKVISLGKVPPSDLTHAKRRLAVFNALRRITRMRLNSDLCFLSYDPYIFFLFYFSKHTVSVVEHNNIDRAEDSPLYRFFYRLLPSRYTHLCFADYIADYVTKAYGKHTSVIQHPLRVMAEPKAVERNNGDLSCYPYLFCPTPPEDWGLMTELLAISKKYGWTIIAKTNRLIPHELRDDKVLHLEEYFPDYDKMFLGASGILILNDYKYRVSGVFYEAIANRKDIFIKKSLFASGVAKNFPGNVITLIERDCLESFELFLAAKGVS